jgi:hypothetical protein
MLLLLSMLLATLLATLLAMRINAAVTAAGTANAATNAVKEEGHMGMEDVLTCGRSCSLLAVLHHVLTCSMQRCGCVVVLVHVVGFMSAGICYCSGGYACHKCVKSVTPAGIDPAPHTTAGAGVVQTLEFFFFLYSCFFIYYYVNVHTQNIAS